MNDFTTESKSIQYEYNGNITPELLSRAYDAFNTYKADKTTLINRIKDNECFYRKSYERLSNSANSQMKCDTSFVFSAIENARADAIENYPVANILERNEEGSVAAEILSKIVPTQLEISGFKDVYKENIRNKYKYGTAIYGVFYNDFTENVDIKSIDITDVYVDMHLNDIQDSQFLFISAVIENDILKEMYPEFEKLFSGDGTIETLTGTYQMKNRTEVLDCYYKKSDGTLHMMKLCKNTIISATEDMVGYEDGLYNHGKYPVVFDVMYPIEHCPFGFGMIDTGKVTQIEIDKLDNSITENIICNAKPRYLAKRSGNVDIEAFQDFEKQIIYYEGDPDSLKPVQTNSINQYYLEHRERKKDELKELLANRDFQQGATSGGVTAASAIETLQQSGEKRSRSLIDDTYDAYKKIVKLTIEIMRQFYKEDRQYRTSDEYGQKEFSTFSRDLMYTPEYFPEGTAWKPIEFDIDVVPQRENPYSRETVNNTMLTFWNSGLFLPQNFDMAIAALKNMSFDGKEKLIRDIQSLQKQQQQQQAMMMQQQQQAQATEINPVNIEEDQQMEQSIQQADTSNINDLIPIDITGGGENG